MSRCPVVRTNGDLCDYVEGHPGHVHVTFIKGWPHHWLLPTTNWRNIIDVMPADPLRDAPEALK